MHDHPAAQDPVDLDLEPCVLQLVAGVVDRLAHHVRDLDVGRPGGHGQGDRGLGTHVGAGVGVLVDDRALVDGLALLLDDLGLQAQLLEGVLGVFLLLADQARDGDAEADGEDHRLLAVGLRSRFGFGLQDLTGVVFGGVDLLLDDVLGLESEVLQLLERVGVVLADQFGHVHRLRSLGQEHGHRVTR